MRSGAMLLSISESWSRCKAELYVDFFSFLISRTNLSVNFPFLFFLLFLLLFLFFLFFLLLLHLLIIFNSSSSNYSSPFSLPLVLYRCSFPTMGSYSSQVFPHLLLFTSSAFFSLSCHFMSKCLISRSASITTEIQPKGTCISTSLRPDLLFKDARLTGLIEGKSDKQVTSV